MNRASRIFVAGHAGLAGSAIVRLLQARDFENVITRKRSELDLEDARAVRDFFLAEKPEYVFVAAGKVGGIVANNTYPADFIRRNLAIALNVISSAHDAKTAKLLYLSSSCVYPKHAPQPMKESDLMTGALEPTNEAYAVAKLAGMKLCESYRRQFSSNFFSVLPTNLYGPGDNFDLQTSHVLPALIRRFAEAKDSGAEHVILWGDGTARREFMHVDDLADACLFLMTRYNDAGPVNIGVGADLTIAELADVVRSIVGYEGAVTYDRSQPNGAPRKLLDVTRIKELGWRPRIDLEDGITQTYRWYRENISRVFSRSTH